MKTLRNINPLGFVDLPLIGREGPVDSPLGEGCLKPGEEFEVSDELAGEAPYWRPTTEADGLGDAVWQNFETRVHDDLLEVFDPGRGLLAQSGNYELVTKKAKG